MHLFSVELMNYSVRMLIKNKHFEFYTKELQMLWAEEKEEGAGSKQMTLYWEMTQYVRKSQGMRWEKQAILVLIGSLAAIQD